MSNQKKNKSPKAVRHQKSPQSLIDTIISGRKLPKRLRLLDTKTIPDYVVMAAAARRAEEDAEKTTKRRKKSPKKVEETA